MPLSDIGLAPVAARIIELQPSEVPGPDAHRSIIADAGKIEIARKLFPKLSNPVQIFDLGQDFYGL
ncbi:hypothetical protein [Bradyrhizobium sp. USDA 376]